MMSLQTVAKYVAKITLRMAAFFIAFMLVYLAWYDARARLLQVQLDDGSTLQYSGVGDGIWQRLSSSGAAWSFYRDNIEEEFTAKRVPL